jgi:multisubunit Na+/H+ antiporter MnhB subunit
MALIFAIATVLLCLIGGLNVNLENLGKIALLLAGGLGVAGLLLVFAWAGETKDRYEAQKHNPSQTPRVGLLKYVIATIIVGVFGFFLILALLSGKRGRG